MFSYERSRKIKTFPWFEVARNASGFYLSQRKYALDIVSKAGLLGAKPSPVPIELNHQLARAEGPLVNDPQYRVLLVGSYISPIHARSWLLHSYSSSIHAEITSSLRRSCITSGSLSQRKTCVFLKVNDSLDISIFNEFDWGACPLSHYSLSAYITFIGESPVTWHIKKHDTVSLSFAEAEDRAMRLPLKNSSG